MEDLLRIQIFTIWDKASPQYNFNRLIFRHLILSVAVSDNKNT